MEIGIPFIDQTLRIDLPPANLLFDVAPMDLPPVKDFKAAICQALQNPIGAPPLAELLRPGWKVVLVSDDNTRPTPVERIMPILLDFFNRAAIPDPQIEIIIASGTHRAMTQAELAAKYGPEVLGRVRVLPHQYQQPEELVNFEVTRRGVPIWVSRRVVEADFRMAVGNIVPHHPAGWSGGAKAVLPGVAGEETVAQMHFLGSRHPALGEVDSEMRREMEDFAAVIGLDFVLNVVLNRCGELVDAVAGHYIDAHRAGVQISKAVYGLPIPALADMTISCTSPIDFDFFQGDKGITSAEKATHPGGEILLVSGCIEGISPAHPELADYVGRLANTEIWGLCQPAPGARPLTGAEAIVINDIKAQDGHHLRVAGYLALMCASLGYSPRPAGRPAHLSWPAGWPRPRT